MRNMKSGKAVQWADPQIVLCTKWCQGDQNIDDKMLEPHAINEEDENANNMQECKRHTKIQRNKNTLRLTTWCGFIWLRIGTGKTGTLIKFSIHLRCYPPFCALVPPPSKHAAVFLCLLLVFSILVFLGSVRQPSARRSPIFFLVYSLVLYYEISH